MDSNQLWEQYASFIRGIAEFFHWKFPSVLELDEKISVAWIFAEKARQHFNPEKGAFKAYSGRVIARGILQEINREIETTYKKQRKTHKIQYSIFKVAGFEGSNNVATIDELNIGERTSENFVYDPEQDYNLADKIGAYRHIASSLGGFYIWLHNVYGLSIKEIAEITGYSTGKINEFIRDFRSE